MNTRRKLITTLCAVGAGAAATLAGPGAAPAQQGGLGDAGLSRPEAGAGPVTRVIVRFRSAADAGDRAEARRDARTALDETLPVRGMQLVDPAPGVSVGAAADRLERSPDVLYAEPDVPRRVAPQPNDPYFSLLWGLHNAGQPVYDGDPAGTVDADIDAAEAWDLTTGAPSVAVGVIDSGVDMAHPDLNPNEWTNPGESGGGRETNGVDDDGNGAIDDVHGYDWVEGDNAPQDEDGHGTHVAGTIGARGNDSEGVAGVSWSSKIVPLRVLDADGRGYVSDAIGAYAYAGRTGLRVANASLGGAQGSQAERDALASAPNTLFAVAAGNGGGDGVGDDNDRVPEYPCNYDVENVICVAATDDRDRLASFSNYGARSVDLGAPGVDIGSTYSGASWVFMDGTSMASPHVAGAAALVRARSPQSSTADVRRALLANVDAKAGLEGRTVTGGRLNAYRAVASVEDGSEAKSTAPPPPAPTPATEPPSGTEAGDTEAPALSVSTAGRQRLGTVLRRGLRPRLGLSEAGTVTSTLEVSSRTARRYRLARTSGAYRVGAATRTWVDAGTQTVTIRLSRKARRRLARVRSVTVTLRARGVDSAGNPTTRSKRITLRR
jgi:thermitase